MLGNAHRIALLVALVLGLSGLAAGAPTWQGASWESATWEGATWEGATWEGASWEGATWEGATWEGAPSDTQGTRWGLLAIRAPQAWAMGPPARSPLVCVVDSGVDASHPALEGRVVASRDLVDGLSASTDPASHGTHVAGIVAQVAPTARFASARVVPSDGHGTTEDLSAGLRWCAGLRPDVILLAVSEDAPTREFNASLRAAQQSGALLVAAAGNAGPCFRCVTSPATAPRVLGVGAVGPDLAPAAFSPDGNHVDLLAPGVRVASAVPGGYRAASGTSQAAAFAAGAAAFLLSAEDADPAKVGRALAKTAREGILDLEAARLALR